MSREKTQGIGFFEKYLTVWVLLCMAAGILIGKFLPGIPAFLGRFEYANVSIPMAILIWLMIYPMMLKVDFQSIKNVGKLVIADLDRHDYEFLRKEQFDVWLGFERSDIRKWFTEANLSNIKIEDLNEQCCCDSCESCSSAAINIFIASAEKSSI